jgi:hypothetical protein
LPAFVTFSRDPHHLARHLGLDRAAVGQRQLRDFL